MNRKTFLKLITFVPVAFCGHTNIPATDETDTKITIYGDDWEYESFNYHFWHTEARCAYHAYECHLYPNKKNREEFIRIPPNSYQRNYRYDYKKGIKTIYSSALINGMTYVKNGKALKIKKEFSTHVGFCDDVCMKIEFIV